MVIVEVPQWARSCMLTGMTNPEPGRDHHSHPGGHDHDHAHGGAVPSRLRHLLRPHSHEAAGKVDAAMKASA
jgi:hypothetical protein